ncbi:hypothetical protein Tco_0155852 [Tanacetum coccineum]
MGSRSSCYLHVAVVSTMCAVCLYIKALQAGRVPYSWLFEKDLGVWCWGDRFTLDRGFGANEDLRWGVTSVLMGGVMSCIGDDLDVFLMGEGGRWGGGGNGNWGFIERCGGGLPTQPPVRNVDGWMFDFCSVDSDFGWAMVDARVLKKRVGTEFVLNMIKIGELGDGEWGEWRGWVYWGEGSSVRNIGETGRWGMVEMGVIRETFEGGGLGEWEKEGRGVGKDGDGC